jgi:hypothetical protein
LKKICLIAIIFTFLAPTSVSASKQINAITWWGDSLTAGAGGAGVTPTEELSKIVGLKVLNRGVGGEGSTEIATRAGAHPLNLKFWSTGKRQGVWDIYQVIPDRALLRQGSNVLGGSINNCVGNLKYENSKYFLQLLKCKKRYSNERVKFQLAGLEATNTKFQIIWAGRNNGGDSKTVTNDVNLMISHFKSMNPEVKIYLLSIINGSGEGSGTSAYKGIMEVNSALASLDAKYIDVRRCLIQDALAGQRLSPSGQDLVDIQNDLVPSQLRSDNIHLNSNGYRAVAECLRISLKSIR